MKKLFILFLLLLIGNNAYANYKYKVTYSKGIYHIVIPFDGKTNRINFVSSENLVTNRKMFKRSHADLVVNAGFFDPKNEKAISFVYTDGILTEYPLLNENLQNNPTIMGNWDKISNRVEFRITKDDNGYIYDICPHNKEYVGELITSAQAGPILLPTMDLEQEFFVVKDEDGNVIRESAGVLQKLPRTLIGLKDNYIHILIVTLKKPMTIYEAKDLCQKYALEKAMAFDGGSSTSFDTRKIHVISTSSKIENTGRKLKSFLILK